MTNPNNATITTVHTAEFTAGDALKIPTLRILRDDGSLYEGAVAPELDKATAIKMYDTMVFIRVLDERMLAAQRQGRYSVRLQPARRDESGYRRLAGQRACRPVRPL